MSKEREREWVKDRVFTRGRIAVTVWKLVPGRPKFRFDIGCLGKEEDDRVFRGFIVGFRGRGKLRMFHDCEPEVLSALVDEALDYMYAEAQASEDKWVERRIHYEEKDLNRGKPRQRPGLKRLGKMDAMSKLLSKETTE